MNDGNGLINILAILPDVPSGTPAEIAKDALEFWSKWIGRAGGLVAFVGLVKMGLGFREENSKETMEGVLVAISGFMIRSAVKTMGVFSTKTTDVETEFTSILKFISSWMGRTGGLAMFLGAIVFALAIRENNANSKILGVRTMAAGAAVVAVSALSVLLSLT